jgi:hypothetical protein
MKKILLFITCYLLLVTCYSLAAGSNNPKDFNIIPEAKDSNRKADIENL